MCDVLMKCSWEGGGGREMVVGIQMGIFCLRQHVSGADVCISKKKKSTNRPVSLNLVH